MPDTGKLVTGGLHAGAIKYLVLDGLIPNPAATSLQACLVTGGLGIANLHKLLLDGLVCNPGGGGISSGGFPVFGGSIISAAPWD